MWIQRLLLFVVAAALLVALYLWAALSWSYSSGERAGWVQKFSKKGWICKTWEGEAALVSMPGSTPEKFSFTVHDEAVARQITSLIGKRMSLHYEEKVGLPSSCFGDTRYFVTRVMLSDEIPFGPGISFPSGAAGASGAASGAAAPTPPATPPATPPTPTATPSATPSAAPAPPPEPASR